MKIENKKSNTKNFDNSFFMKFSQQKKLPFTR